MMDKVQKENEAKWSKPANAATETANAKASWWNSGAAAMMDKVVKENQEHHAKQATADPQPAGAQASRSPTSASRRVGASPRPVLQLIFDCMDAQCEGKIEKAELEIFMRVVGAQVPRAVASQLEAGTISLSQKEFIDMFEDQLRDTDLDKHHHHINDIFKLPRDGIVKLTEIFQIIDKDNSGFVDTDELMELGSSFSSTFTPERCNKLLSRMDYNHDGKIALDEFLAFFGNFCSGMPDRQRERGLNGLKIRAEVKREYNP